MTDRGRRTGDALLWILVGEVLVVSVLMLLKLFKSLPAAK